jgi:hypothetical protein
MTPHGRSPQSVPEAVQDMARVWPDEGGRQKAYRALIGGLLRGGVAAEIVEGIVTALVEAAGDDEPARRCRIIQDRAKKLKQQRKVSG